MLETVDNELRKTKADVAKIGTASLINKWVQIRLQQKSNIRLN